MSDDALETVDEAAGAPTVDYGRRKRRIVLMLLAWSPILGIISPFLPEETTTLDYVVGLPLLILGISWCFTDADERDHRIGLLMKSILVFMFAAGLPIYLLQTRGIRGFKSIALMMLFVGSLFACAFATEIATLHVGEAFGLWELDE